MNLAFEWPLDKVIKGLLESPNARHRNKPSRSPRFTRITKENVESVWHMEMKNIDQKVEIKLFLDGARTSNSLLNDFEIILKCQNDVEWACFRKKEVFSPEFSTDCCSKTFICASALQYLHDKEYKFFVTCNMKLWLFECKINNSMTLSVTTGFENLMDDVEFSDLVLVAAGKQFRVHKNILAARSQVFSNLIKQNMREGKQSVIEIAKFNGEVVQELIHYIYSGRVDKLEKLSKSLLEAAECYNIEGLKIICLEEFCRNMTVKNSCKLLLLLDEYNIHDLKSQVLEFIVCHLKYMSESDFTLFNKPNLLKEIFFKTVEVHVIDS